MTTRQPSNVTDAPAAAQAATPGAGEAARYAPAADLPDAATIARMANAFYATPALGACARARGGAAVGAGVRSRADVQLAARRAGAAAAAVAEPQSRPAAHADPGLGRGAAVGAGVRHRADARSGAVFAGAELRPAAGRQGRQRCTSGAAGADAIGTAAGRRRARRGSLAARHPERRRPRLAALLAGRRDVAHSELRRCALPVRPQRRWQRSGHRLGRSRRHLLVPRPRRGACLRPVTALRRRRDAGRRCPVASSAALPFALDVSVLDLSGLGFQHSPGLGAPADRHHRRARVRSLRDQARLPDPAAERVNGRPLVWLDNARDDAEAAGGDRSPRRTSTSTRTPTSTARAHTLAARATDAYEAAREKVRALHQRAVGRRDHLRARHDRGHQPHRQELGPAQRRARATRSSSRMARAPRQHRALAAARRREGRRLRVAPVDDTGQIILDEYEKLLTPRTQLVVVHARSRTRSARSRRSREMIAIAHRHGATRARRRRAGGLAHAGRRAGARLRLLRVLRPQDVRARPASALVYGKAERARGHAAVAGRRQHDPGRHLREDDVTTAARRASRRAPATSPTRSVSARRSTT